PGAPRFERRREPGHGLPGRHPRLAPARALPLGLHLPDTLDARCRAGPDLRRPRPLLQRDPARRDPEGRGPRLVSPRHGVPRPVRELRPGRLLRPPDPEGGLTVRALLRVVVKEFLQLRQDRKMIPVLFVGPIVQLLALGYAANM